MFRVSRSRGLLGIGLLGLALAGAGVSSAQQQSREERHGRKYKAPPETARVEVLVVKDFNGKPIQNAAVIFRPVEDGDIKGSFEVKTGPDGKAFIDVLPVGSSVIVQVLANGYATYAKQYEIAEAKKEVEVRVLRPQEQVSAYQDNSGKEATRKAGVQEGSSSSKPAAKPNTPSTTPAPKQ